MICLCGTNLDDADAKNNPSVMVANSPKLNYCILLNGCNNLIRTCGSFVVILCKIFIILY